MLERAVAAVKEDKAKALDMSNKGEGGFKDRDCDVWCANASDGIVIAHPVIKGKQLRDIKGKHGHNPFCAFQTAVTRTGRKGQKPLNIEERIPAHHDRRRLHHQRRLCHEAG